MAKRKEPVTGNTESPAPAANSAPGSSANASPPATVRKPFVFPEDRPGQIKVAKEAYLYRAGENILKQQFEWVISDSTGLVAEAFVESIRESVQPRDATEEMLMLQMIWTHARVAKLSSIASQQVDRNNLRIVSEACDRAANTYRRQMLALAEYRRPAKTSSFVAIKQANLANQQVVHNAENSNSFAGSESNEQGSRRPSELPSHQVGTGIPSFIDPAEPAVAMEHGSDHARREGEVQDERDDSR